MKFKRLVSLLLCFALCSGLLLLTAGCGEKRAAEQAFTPLEKYDRISTTCVAENDRYSLIWNAERKCVILYDKVMDYEWSYIPEKALNTSYDYSLEEKGATATIRPQVKSPIIVHYYNTGNFQEDETNAFAMSIDKGKYTVTPTENGLIMTCYFLDRELTVPVEFTLTDKGVDVSVDPTKIEENELYNVYAITLAPFFCSVSNDNINNDDYYLFTPSGSGAIVRPDVDNTKDAAVEITEEVYGKDLNITKFEEKTLTETIRMPVFGAVNGDKGVCAIIKDGAGAANISTTIGQKFTGYSYVSPEFLIRGYQEVVQKLFTSTIVKTKLYADAFTADKICVGFYPLYDEDASYVGMANTYRDYLTEKGALKAEKSNDSLVNIKLVGGIETTEFHFGIPSDAMLVATTVKQAQNIIKDLKERTGLESINANLVGFGKSGNDIGTVAGGYALGKDFGKEADLEKLIEYSKKNGVNLYMNFDMVRFKSSGGGVNTTFGKAESATGSFTELKYNSISMRSPDLTLGSHFLVTRGKFSTVAANINEAAKDWKLGGISLDTLTSLSYSDYTEKEYYSRANFEEQASAILNKFSENGFNVAGSDANAFAAACCTHVYDVPTQSSKYRSFTYDVPFYQLVFKGSVSMSGSSINLSNNERVNFLKAVESGLGLTYTLVGQYNTNLITSAQNVFYGSMYWDETIGLGVRDDIVETVAEYKAYFDSVNGAKIVDHKIITEDVRLTTFDNGVKVYVNYGTKDYTEGDITVTALGFQVKGA